MAANGGLNAQLAATVLSQIDWKKLYPDVFAYSFDITTGLAAAAQTTVLVNIQSDGSFIITDLIGTALTANTVLTGFGDQEFVNLTVQITDSASGRNFFDRPIPFNHIFGQGGSDGYQLPVPKLVQNNATLTFTFTNNGAIAITRIYGTLLGVKTLSR